MQDYVYLYKSHIMFKVYMDSIDNTNIDTLLLIFYM